MLEVRIYYLPNADGLVQAPEMCMGREEALSTGRHGLN